MLKVSSKFENELFMFSFGQDFYSRHLGRGTRKFLNLYTGYQIGDIIATSQISKSNLVFVSPSCFLAGGARTYAIQD